jgi:hypothetical protein
MGACQSRTQARAAMKSHGTLPKSWRHTPPRPHAPTSSPLPIPLAAASRRHRGSSGAWVALPVGCGRARGPAIAPSTRVGHRWHEHEQCAGRAAGSTEPQGRVRPPVHEPVGVAPPTSRASSPIVLCGAKCANGAPNRWGRDRRSYGTVTAFRLLRKRLWEVWRLSELFSIGPMTVVPASQSSFNVKAAAAAAAVLRQPVLSPVPAPLVSAPLPSSPGYWQPRGLAATAPQGPPTPATVSCLLKPVPKTSNRLSHVMPLNFTAHCQRAQN